MKNTRVHIDAPALGCKVGQAYQKMLSQLAAELKRAGLTITTGEYLILRAVYHQEGLQQCEIAEKVGKNKAAVCRCVAGLIKKDLLSVEPVSYKCLKVFLTDKSRELEPQIMEVATRRHKALADLTTEENLEIFTRILDKIITSK